MNRINDLGYLERKKGGIGKATNATCAYRDWYFGKKCLKVTIHSLPPRFWGKHIRIKIEEVQ